MKEMIYSNERKQEILDEGDYLNHHYIILNLGIHPTAYVEMKKQLLRDEIDNIECHGGVTYNDKSYWNKNDNRDYIGWNYGHYDDWNGFLSDDYNLEHWFYKYKTEEIYDEVKNVIEQLVVIEYRPMELKHTINLMTSEDYKDRFKAEYYQLKIRYEKLDAMVKNWDNLSFEPTCSKETFNTQLEIMLDYLKILEVRANIEDIELN